MEKKVVFCLYDSRYLSNPERAVLYTTCESLKKAKTDKRESFTDAVIVKEELLWQEDTDSYKVLSSEIIAF